jgi:ribosomal protein S21
VFFVPIVVKSKNDDHPGDMIKKFKKLVVATDIVQKVKDRRYYMKPSEVHTQRWNEIRRSKKRLRAIKKMKNPPPSRPPRRVMRPHHESEEQGS